jgi:adiponectin receptor
VIDNILAPGEILNYIPMWPLYVNLLTAVICFGCSAYYHTCRTISEDWFRFLLGLDHAGIAFIMAGSCLPLVHYTYACHSVSHYRRPFEIVILSLAVMALFGAFLNSGKGYGPVLFSIIGCIMPVPFYFLWFNKLDTDMLLYESGNSERPYVIAAAVMLTGVVILLTKMPERIVPKKFDLVGASHQLWHIATLIGYGILF